MLAAKSMLGRLGVQTNEQENSTRSQLLAGPPATATALPFEGNLNPGALIPVVVQPRLLPVRTDAHTVEIAVPPTPEYDVVEAETVRLTLPACALRALADAAQRRDAHMHLVDTSHDRRDVRACSARRSEGVPRVAKWGGSRVPRMLCKTRPHDDEKVQISVPRRTSLRKLS